MAAVFADRLVRVVDSAPPADDERALLIRFELLLEREEEAVVAHDAAAIGAVAEERVLLTARLADAARTRHARPTVDAAEDAALVALYRGLRQRHEVRAQVLRRHNEHHRRALSVLAQATGDTSFYKADGSVALQFVTR